MGYISKTLNGTSNVLMTLSFFLFFFFNIIYFKMDAWGLAKRRFHSHEEKAISECLLPSVLKQG